MNTYSLSCCAIPFGRLLYELYPSFRRIIALGPPTSHNFLYMKLKYLNRHFLSLGNNVKIETVFSGAKSIICVIIASNKLVNQFLAP